MYRSQKSSKLKAHMVMFIFFDRALRSYGPLLQKMRKVFGELMVNLSQSLMQNGGKMNLLIQKEQTVQHFLNQKTTS